MSLRDTLFRIARTVHPRLDTFPEDERSEAAGYVIRALVFFPLAALGVGWLITLTDLTTIRANWLFLLLTLILTVILSRLWLQTYYFTTTGGYRSDRRSFWGEAMWSAVLVLGPSAAWLGVALPWLTFIAMGLRGTRLNRLRVFSQSILRTAIVLMTLIEAALYERFGGVYPLPGLTLPDLIPAVAATLIGFGIGWVMITGGMALIRTMAPPSPEQQSRVLPISRFTALMGVVGPFMGLLSLLPAGLYSVAGAGGFFAYWLITLGGIFATDQTSRMIEIAQRRTAELERLEQLSRAIIQSPAEIDALAALLRERVPSLLPGCQVAIRLQTGEVLVIHPAEWSGPDSVVWDWSAEFRASHICRPGDVRPWSGEAATSAMLVIPVMSGGDISPVGCIYLETSQYGRGVDRLVPAVQALAGQIASALHSRDVVQQQIAERVARERADQELALGANIQARFLPREKLEVDGWGLAAALVPARETSGDFYDFFPLSGGQFGIVVADVADKGLGAAFYMALSMTLLRTYAAQYAARYPKTYTQRVGDVLREVNLQLIHDAGADMFVTLFYGIVNPRTGVMRYANAGHNPPLLLRRDRRRRARELRRTGVPLGMFPEQRWGRRMARIGEGDAVVLYTDGVVEAQNPTGEMFEIERLDQVMRNSLRESPQALHDIVLGALYSFIGSEEPFDDITLMVLQREEQP